MNRDEITSLLNFYASREQGGGGMEYHYTPYSYQKGSGIGAFLSGLYRGLIPWVQKSTNYLTPHLMKALSEVVHDYQGNPTPENLTFSLRNRSLGALENVTSDAITKMRGGKLGMVRQKRKVAALTAASAPAKRKSRATAKPKSVKRSKLPTKRSVKSKPSSRAGKKKTQPKAIEYPFF